MKNSSPKVMPSAASRKLATLKGTTSVEYGILTGLVAVVAIVALFSTGTWVSDTYDTVANHLAGEDKEQDENGSAEEVLEEPEGPKGPYDDFFDPDTFLIGTPDIDNLNMANGGPWAGVMALELEDDIVDTSAAEIIIPGPGNDIIDHAGGDDTYVYAKGDGYDYIEYVAGNLTYEFPNISSTEATLIVSRHDFVIGLPDGEVRSQNAYFSGDGKTNPTAINFSDISLDDPAIRARAVEDAKPSGRVYLTGYDEPVIHRFTTDGSYEIKYRIDGDHTLRFSQTTYDQSRFRVVGYGTDMRIYTPDDDYVEIEYHVYPGLTGTIDTLEFADETSPTMQEVVNKAAEDGKAWGKFWLTEYDEELFHTASSDDSYIIDGKAGGFDTLTFTQTAYDDTRFRLLNYGKDLAIYTPDDDYVQIDHHTYKSLFGKVDEIIFADDKIPTMQEIVNKAAEDGKAWPKLYLSEHDETMFHTAAVDGSYVIDGQTGGYDALTFADVAYGQTRFRVTGGGRHLAIYTPDDDYVSIEYYFTPSLAGKVDEINFADGKTPTLQEALDKANDDGKAWGRLYLTDHDDKVVHTFSADPSYYIDGMTGGNDSLIFSETTWEEAAFTDSGYNGAHLNVYTPDGDKITIEYFLHSSLKGKIDTITFADGKTPTTQEIIDRLNKGPIAGPKLRTRWQTDAPKTRYMDSDPDSDDKTIRLALQPGNHDAWIDWGDGSPVTRLTSSMTTNDRTHTYATPGIYDVTITGKVDGFGFGGSARDEHKLLDIMEWGDTKLADGGFQFRSAVNMAITATDAPDLSGVSSFANAFASPGATARTQTMNIGHWDVSSITDMRRAFWSHEEFQTNIGGWDVSNVRDFEHMFAGAESFNAPIGGWDMSSAETIVRMFDGATSFDKPIGNWNVSGVIDMDGVFFRASSFNQPLNWNTANVDDMWEMFYQASSFNQPLNWSTGSVKRMDRMFFEATSFNQNLSGWCVSNFRTVNTDEPYQPEGFDIGATSYTEARPVWGTCPN